LFIGPFIISVTSNGHKKASLKIQEGFLVAVGGGHKHSYIDYYLIWQLGHKMLKFSIKCTTADIMNVNEYRSKGNYEYWKY